MAKGKMFDTILARYTDAVERRACATSRNKASPETKRRLTREVNEYADALREIAGARHKPLTPEPLRRSYPH
jgi:hypothetical protein